MNDILANPELSLSESIDAFLMTTDYKAFNESKKQIEQGLSKRDFRSFISRRSIENNLEILDLEKLQTVNKYVGRN